MEPRIKFNEQINNIKASQYKAIENRYQAFKAKKKATYTSSNKRRQSYKTTMHTGVEVMNTFLGKYQ